MTVMRRLNRFQKPLFKICIHIKTFDKKFFLLLKRVNWFKVGSKYLVTNFLKSWLLCFQIHNHGCFVFSIFKGNIFSMSILNNFNIVIFSNRLWNEFCKVFSLNIHLMISLKDLHVTSLGIPSLPQPWPLSFLVDYHSFLMDSKFTSQPWPLSLLVDLYSFLMLTLRIWWKVLMLFNTYGIFYDAFS